MFTSPAPKARQVSLVAILFLCTICYSAPDAAAQNAQQKTWLTERAHEFAREHLQDQADVQRLAGQLGPVAQNSQAQVRSLELQRLVNGWPIFYITENAESAAALSADKVYAEAGHGYALSGASVSVGVWDGGAVRADHQELTGRVVSADGSANPSQHATHVAGTIAAAGLNPAARGLAYNATILSNDWSRDRAEMAAAAADGLLVSNHSYGQAVGWVQNARNDGKWGWYGNTSVDPTEDYRFGYYDWMAREWDDIAYHAPHYLMVKAAGNDRDDAPAPGEEHWVIDRQTYQWALSTDVRDGDGGADGYDSIIDAGNAKNVLTVGAVAVTDGGYRTPADVQATSFSGWGPTDDGRIKPDVVTAGVRVYSPLASSSTSYGSMSGTSMAAPAATGAIALLLEHAADVRPGKPLLASTVKALLIHTADEAGPAPGPDYAYGWGLINTLGAADVLTRDADAGGDANIREETLLEGEQLSFNVVSDGREPLRITAAWTDPAGTTPPLLANPDVHLLVNDLDVDVTAPDGTVYHPWILDPANPSAPATTGINTRDNSEQVVVASPIAGTYAVRVTFKPSAAGKKGAVASSQAVSIIATGGADPRARALPVELALFEASLNGDVAHLAWQTSAEQNNAGFEVQHATPGTDVFQGRGFVEGHGTTTQAHAYAFQTQTLAPGTHRFRLRQVDFDGTAQYSAEIAVEVALPGRAHLSEVWPNPFNPQAQFTLSVKKAQAVQVAVFNALGRQVALLHEGSLEADREHRFTFKADGLPSGVYFIRATGETFTQTRRATLLK